MGDPNCSPRDGFDYMTATNVLEAAQTYKAHPCRFRVVIIDISMPEIDGFDVSQHIHRIEKDSWSQMSESAREDSRRTIFAALTGLDSVEAQKEAFGSGIDTF
ncbi:hypothetical protein EYZ11_012634 [Aspergillus tanneri]|uniref:Response regulatory domain-containing protein n=1 Tax=Aspergillus tanneri TaxID=1220188 RepID=A0A4S3J547_9EURO|nr:hypothetical protein EYZ11_012634 [Aspergillus tanneri]